MKKLISKHTKNDCCKENIRKILHIFGGMLIPIFILLLQNRICIILNIVLLLPVLIIDYNNWFYFLNKIPKGNLIIQLLREHEMIKGKLNGLSWLLLGTFAVICFCDKYLSALSISIFIIGDAMAAIIGKNFGKIKLCCNKTLEGTLSFILSSCIIAFGFVKYIVPETCIFNIYYITFAIFISSIVELVSKNIGVDDNFTLPLSFCMVYKCLEVVFN